MQCAAWLLVAVDVLCCQCGDSSEEEVLTAFLLVGAGLSALRLRRPECVIRS